MPSFTRNAIKASFIKLLNERPLNQITVKDIVEDCGVNRNSFYYHFEDLPSMIEEIVTDEADKIIAEYSNIDSLEQCLDLAIRFAMENRRAALHIYNSVNRDIFERYLRRVCHYVVSTYVDGLLKDHPIHSEDKAVIVRFYQCECFGQIIEWMDSGMKEDMRASFHRLCELRHGTYELMLSRCRPAEKN